MSEPIKLNRTPGGAEIIRRVLAERGFFSMEALTGMPDDEVIDHMEGFLNGMVRAGEAIGAAFAKSIIAAAEEITRAAEDE